MEPSRIYKIKIRENILRQVLFTDRNLFIGFIIAIICLIWKMLPNAPIDLKTLLSLSISGIALLIFTIKIDRQSIIKIIPRSLNYLKRIKKIRF